MEGSRAMSTTDNSLAATKRRKSTKLLPLSAGDIEAEDDVRKLKALQGGDAGAAKRNIRYDTVMLDRQLDAVIVFQPVFFVRLYGYYEPDLVLAVHEAIAIHGLGDRLVVSTKQFTYLDDGSVVMRYPDQKIDPVFRETSIILAIRDAIQSHVPEGDPPEGASSLAAADPATRAAQAARWRMIDAQKELITMSDLRTLGGHGMPTSTTSVRAASNRRQSFVMQTPSPTGQSAAAAAAVGEGRAVALAKREAKDVEMTSCVFTKREEVTVAVDITEELTREVEHSELEGKLLQIRAERASLERGFANLCDSNTPAAQRAGRVRMWLEAIEKQQISIGFTDDYRRLLLHWVVDWAEDIARHDGGRAAVAALIKTCLELGMSCLAVAEDGLSAAQLAASRPLALEILRQECAATCARLRCEAAPLSDCVFETAAGTCVQLLPSATQPHIFFSAERHEKATRVVMYDLQLERTQLIFEPPPPPQLSASCEDPGAVTHLRVVVIPFCVHTHGTTSSDILHASDGTLIGVDHTAASPRLTFCSTAAQYDVLGEGVAGSHLALWHWVHASCGSLDGQRTEEKMRSTEEQRASLRLARSSYIGALAKELQELEAQAVEQRVAADPRQAEEDFARRALLFPHLTPVSASGGGGGGGSGSSSPLSRTSIDAPQPLLRRRGSTRHCSMASVRGGGIGQSNNQHVETAGLLCCIVDGAVVACYFAVEDVRGSATAPLSERVRDLAAALNRRMPYAQQDAASPLPLSATPVAAVASGTRVFLATPDGQFLLHDVRAKVGTQRQSDDHSTFTSVEGVCSRRASRDSGEGSSTERPAPLASADFPTSCAFVPAAVHKRSGRPLPAMLAWGGNDVLVHEVLSEADFTDVFSTQGLLTLQAHVEDLALDTEAASVAASPIADPRGVYILRRGELLRYDVARRIFSLIARVPLTESELEYRLRQGDGPSGKATSGAQLLTFNCDGSLLIRWNAAYRSAAVYRASTQLGAIVAATERAIMCDNNWSCGGALDDAGSHGCCGTAGADATQAAVPKERLKGYLTQLTSVDAIDAAGRQRRIDHAFMAVEAVRHSNTTFGANDADLDGRNAAHVVATACANRDVDFVTANRYWATLLQRGANLYAVSKHGRRPIDELESAASLFEEVLLYGARQLEAIGDYGRGARRTVDDANGFDPTFDVAPPGAVEQLRHAMCTVPDATHAVLSQCGRWVYAITPLALVAAPVDDAAAAPISSGGDGGGRSDSDGTPAPMRSVVTIRELHARDARDSACAPGVTRLPLAGIDGDVLLSTDGAVIVVRWGAGDTPDVASALVPHTRLGGHVGDGRRAVAATAAVVMEGGKAIHDDAPIAHLVTACAAPENVGATELGTEVHHLTLQRRFFSDWHTAPSATTQLRAVVTAIEHAAAEARLTGIATLNCSQQLLAVDVCGAGVAVALTQGPEDGAPCTILLRDGRNAADAAEWRQVALGGEHVGVPPALPGLGEGHICLALAPHSDQLFVAAATQRLLVLSLSLNSVAVGAWEGKVEDAVRSVSLISIDPTEKPVAETVVLGGWLAHPSCPGAFQLFFVREGLLCVFDSDQGTVRLQCPLYLAPHEVRVATDVDGDDAAFVGRIGCALVGESHSVALLSATNVARPQGLVLLRVNTLHGFAAAYDFDELSRHFDAAVPQQLRTLCTVASQEMVRPQECLPASAPPRTCFLRGYIARMSSLHGTTADELRQLRIMIRSISAGAALPGQRDRDGRTAFHLLRDVRERLAAASSRGGGDDEARALTACLLELGCSPFLCDAQGRTAMDDPAMHALVHACGLAQQRAAVCAGVVPPMVSTRAHSAVACGWSAVTPSVLYAMDIDGAVHMINTVSTLRSLVYRPPAQLQDGLTAPAATAAAVPTFIVTSCPHHAAGSARLQTSATSTYSAGEIAVDDARPTDILLLSNGAVVLVIDPTGDAVVVPSHDSGVRFSCGIPPRMAGFAAAPPSRHHMGAAVVWLSRSDARGPPTAPLAVLLYADHERRCLCVRRLYRLRAAATFSPRHFSAAIHAAPEVRVTLPEAVAGADPFSGIVAIQHCGDFISPGNRHAASPEAVAASAALAEGAFFVTFGRGLGAATTLVLDCPSTVPLGVVAVGRDGSVTQHNLAHLEARRASSVVLSAARGVRRQHTAATLLAHTNSSGGELTAFTSGGVYSFRIPSDLGDLDEHTGGRAVPVVKGETHHEVPATTVVDAPGADRDPRPGGAIIAVVDGFFVAYCAERGTILHLGTRAGGSGAGDHAVAFAADGSALLAHNLHTGDISVFATEALLPHQGRSSIAFSTPVRLAPTVVKERTNEYVKQLQCRTRQEIEWAFHARLAACADGAVSFNARDADGRTLMHLLGLWAQCEAAHTAKSTLSKTTISSSSSRGAPLEVERAAEFLLGGGASLYVCDHNGRTAADEMLAVVDGTLRASITGTLKRYAAAAASAMPRVQLAPRTVGLVDVRAEECREAIRWQPLMISDASGGFGTTHRHVAVAVVGDRVVLLPSVAAGGADELKATSIHEFSLGDDGSAAAADHLAAAAGSHWACVVSLGESARELVLCSDGTLMALLADAQGRVRAYKQPILRTGTAPTLPLGPLCAFCHHPQSECVSLVMSCRSGDGRRLCGASWHLPHVAVQHSAIGDAALVDVVCDAVRANWTEWELPDLGGELTAMWLVADEDRSASTRLVVHANAALHEAELCAGAEHGHPGAVSLELVQQSRTRTPVRTGCLMGGCVALACATDNEVLLYRRRLPSDALAQQRRLASRIPLPLPLSAHSSTVALSPSTAGHSALRIMILPRDRQAPLLLLHVDCDTLALRTVEVRLDGSICALSAAHTLGFALYSSSALERQCDSLLLWSDDATGGAADRALKRIDNRSASVLSCTNNWVVTPDDV